jgi:hypothetical protein
MTPDTDMMQMVSRFSDPGYTEPELADPLFTEKVKTHLREMYKRTADIKKQAETDLLTARKSGAHIGQLILRKRTADKLMKQIAEHGKRAVYLSPEDREVMFTHYTEDEFITHLSFYLTQYE